MTTDLSSPNWNNGTLFVGDNLDVMRGMNSGSVDLIYLDPPFNSNQNYARAHRKRGGRRCLQGHLDTG